MKHFLIIVSIFTLAACNSIQESVPQETQDSQEKQIPYNQDDILKSGQIKGLDINAKYRKQVWDALLIDRTADTNSKYNKIRLFLDNLYEDYLKIAQKNQSLAISYYAGELLNSIKSLNSILGEKAINPTVFNGRRPHRHFKTVYNFLANEIIDDKSAKFLDATLSSLFADYENKNRHLIIREIVDPENEQTIKLFMQNIASHLIRRGFEVFISTNAFRGANIIIENISELLNVRKSKRMYNLFAEQDIDAKEVIIENFENALNIKDIFELRGEQIEFHGNVRRVLKQVNFSNEALEQDHRYRKLQLIVDKLLE